MKYFLTGSTGFIGHELAKILIDKGHAVHLLVRSPEKAASLGTENVTLFRGDVTDIESVNNAMKGCSGVFHLAALAKVWSRNPDISFQTNVAGTRNILEAAFNNRVERVVFTSSAGTLRPSGMAGDVHEESEKPVVYLTEYERTKSQAEDVCLEYAKKGLDIVIVNPSRVYGPGLISESNSVTKIISLYRKGKWHILPGDGNSYGNYVFINDVVSGHLLAMERGIPGNRYILGGENVTFSQFFDLLAEACGRKNSLIKLSAPLMSGVANTLFLSARLFHKDPLITPAWVERYLQHRRLSCEKARAELGYSVTPLKEGFKETIKWLDQQKNTR